MFSKIEYCMPAHMLEAYRIERKTVWNAVDYRHILVLMLEGSCEFSIDGKAHIAQTGDAVYVPAGTQYTRRPLEDQPATFCYLHFETTTPVREEKADALLEEVLRWDDSPPGEAPATEPVLLLPAITHLGGELEAIVSQLLDALYNSRPHVRMLADMHLHALLMRITSVALEQLLANNQGTVQERVSPKLREAIAYIYRNYTTQIRPSTLCAVCGISQQHLIRLFKAETNMTPIQYINNYRVSRAQMMIRDHPHLSVKEIAYELGFENPHYFSRIFTQILGESPRSMRSRVQRAEQDRKL